MSIAHRRMSILRVIALTLILTLFLPTIAAAAPNVKLKAFGDRGLDVYRSYSWDENMLVALIAVDLADGRSTAWPDATILSRVAQSMAQAYPASTDTYIDYYTANSAYKARIREQAARLSGIRDIFTGKVFPIASKYEVWYGDSWGAARGDSGERSHAGIDLAVAYGTPIRSMGDGVIEALGWNTLGGWRIGVRDRDGLYYYYAHMSSFAPGMRVGTRVSAGQTIGYVGDSGYGPEGTTGVVSAHLHIGFYEGSPKVSANPYALLNWTR
jgi:murein DD-endopeptidase MepM/ murein hydrolase activator NlpD